MWSKENWFLGKLTGQGEAGHEVPELKPAYFLSFFNIILAKNKIK